MNLIMTNHLQIFQTNSDYNAFKYDYENNTRPNVVLVKKGQKIHFNKLYRPVIHATFNATSNNSTAINNNIHAIKSLKVDGQEMVTNPPVVHIEVIKLKKNKITINSNNNVTNFPSSYVKSQCVRWTLKPTNADIKIANDKNTALLILYDSDGIKGAIGNTISSLDLYPIFDEDNNSCTFSNGFGFNNGVKVGMMLATRNQNTGNFELLDTTCIVEYTTGGLSDATYNLTTGEHSLEIKLLDNFSLYRIFNNTCISSITKLKDCTQISHEAFYRCTSLTSITIPNSVTYIGDYAFSNCSNLTEIAIPNSVTEIGEGAFYYCNGLTSIAIPDSVTKIDEYVFQYCSALTEFKGDLVSEDKRCIIINGELIGFAPAGLTSYTIPNGITSIGNYVFSSCSKLTEITIPDSVTSIGNGAFEMCTSLTGFNGKFATEDNLALIVDNELIAFAPASDVTTYAIPEGVTSIGDNAFYLCKGLTSIIIPDSVTSIDAFAFSGCSSLVSVYCKAVTPPTAIFIGDNWGAFSNNASGRKFYVPGESVEAYRTADGWSSYANQIIKIQENSDIFYTSSDGKVITPYKTSVFGANIVSNTYENGVGIITFDGDVTSIGYSAFYNCSKLTSITIPDSVTKIGESAFSGCTYLSSVNLGNGVTSIDYRAFNSCSKLASITIPDSVTSIGGYAFYSCYGLTSITIPDSVTSIGGGAFCECENITEFKGKFATEDNLALIANNKLIAFAPASDVTTYTIPDGVTSIGESAFENCDSLTEIVIPNSVTEIGEGAFDNCSALASITIPDGVTSIGESAFENCKSLTSITIPDSVTSIAENAFKSCVSLTEIIIPDSVTSIGYGAFYQCKNLTSVYCQLMTPPAGATDMFKDNASGRKIYVPMASVDAYKSAQYWSSYASSIIGFVKNNEIAYTSSDSTIVTPYSSSVFGANIVSNTYENGVGIITFDDDVTSIGQSAFYTCSTLTSVTIPDSVTSIGNYAFYLCTALASVNIPNGVTSIENSTFFGCFDLASITIPDSVTTIGSMAFQGCSSLTEITIPSSVNAINTQALYCNSLTSVYCKPTIPPTAGSSIFWDNVASRKIYVPMASVDAYKSAQYWRGYADAIVGYNF